MAELFAAILQIFGELLLQIVLEVLGELGLHSVKEVFRRPEPLSPWLAAIGYALLGGAAGGVSLLVLPAHMIQLPWVRVANLALTPISAGLFMSVIGSWRSSKGQETVRLDKFGYGVLFAFAMALVRFIWAHG